MTTSVRTARRATAGAILIAAAALVSLPALSTADVASADVATDETPQRAAATDACGAARFKADGTRWTCTFVDNFGGAGLDPDKWVVAETKSNGYRSGKTCYTASDRNVAVRDGFAHLTADEGRWIRCKNPVSSFSTRYTGGMIGTRGKFSQTNGWFEVRAKLPEATTSGLHGGFWMYPVDLAYGAWPASGEIDVAEWWSFNATVLLPSLHYDGDDPEDDSGWACTVVDASVFHTYALEWLRGSMRFYLDGHLCWTRAWTPAAPLVRPAPFDKPFSMILNMGVGTARGANKVTSRTPFPASYVIDYAKAWR